MSSLKDLLKRFSHLEIKQNDERMQINTNTLLDEIISLVHSIWKKDYAMLQEEIMVFINLGCNHLQEANLLMKSKFSQAVSYFIINGKIIPDEPTTDNLIMFMCNTIKQPLPPRDVQVDIIKVLVSILECVTSQLTRCLFDIEIIFWDVINGTTDTSTQSLLLQGLTIIFPRMQEQAEFTKEDFKHSCHVTLKYIVSLVDHHQDTIDICKLEVHALRYLLTIFNFVKQNDELLEPAYVIAVLKIFLICGLPDMSSKLEKLKKNIPKVNQDSAATLQPISRKERYVLPKKMVNKKRSKKASQKGPPNDNDEHNSNANQMTFSLRGDNGGYTAIDVFPHQSSESEFSDSEMGHLEKLRNVSSRVRQNSLRCMQGLLKRSERKSKFSCWLPLLPENVSPNDISLMQILTDDPNFKVRQHALVCIMELVDGSRPFLDAAVMSLSHDMHPFTAFSIKLNESLMKLHLTLMEALSREVADTGIEKVVRCLMLVVLNSPYNKLDQNVLLQFIPKLGTFLNSKDTNLLVSSLTCLAAIMSVKPNQQEITSQLNVTNCPKSIIHMMACNKCKEMNCTSWLMIFCCHWIHSAIPADSDQDVQRTVVECLQILGVITKHYPHLIRPYHSSIVKLLHEKCFSWEPPSVAFFSIKLFEEFGRLYDGLCSDSSNHLTEALAHWQDVLKGSLLTLPQDEQKNCPPKVKGAVCDCISTIGTHVLSALPIHQQICCKTLLLGLANDDDNFAKSASIRALGVLVLYPSAVDDPGFFSDVTRICIEHMKSPSIAVRSKVSWSLGNVCDAMVKNSSNEAFCDLQIELHLKLLKTASHAAVDHDKVKLNGVRGIGLLLKALSPTLVDNPLFSNEIDAAVKAVLPSVTNGPMKGRWNACYAIAHIFQNKHIQLGKAVWTGDVYDALIDAMVKCKNFKVRLSAVSALTKPNCRSSYGSTQLFHDIWKGVVDALEASDELTDFTEFKYKDALQVQLVEVLLHLIPLMTKDDALKLNTAMDSEAIECMKNHMNRYCINSGMMPDEIEEAVAEKCQQLDASPRAETIYQVIKSLETLLESQGCENVALLKSLLAALTFGKS